MKTKLFIVVLTIMVLVGIPLFADFDLESFKPTDDNEYKLVTEPFLGTNIRSMGMGGAGLGVRGYHDSFLMNPANLSKSGFTLSLPSVTVTAFNAQKILASGALDLLLSDDEDQVTDGAVEILKTIKKNYSDVLTTDVSTAFTLGGFGLAIEAQERLMAFREDTFMTANMIAQLTAAVTLGFGMRINAVPNILSIDLGLNVQAVYKTYLTALTASPIISKLMEGEGKFEELKPLLLNETPLVAGWAVPISIGANFNFPYGLSLSAVARNINGNYTMTTYGSLNDWGETLLKKRFTKDAPKNSAILEEGWTMESPWSLDFGFTWAPTFLGNIIKPTIAIDVVDVMAMGGKQADELTQSFLEQTRLGASVRLLSMFDVRYGLNQGYQSIGVGFDLLVFHIDAAYYTLNYGSGLASKESLDALSLRFSIGSR